MRRNISGKKHARKFNKVRRRTKAINNPGHIARGGFRF